MYGIISTKVGYLDDEGDIVERNQFIGAVRMSDIPSTYLERAVQMYLADLMSEDLNFMKVDGKLDPTHKYTIRKRHPETNHKIFKLVRTENGQDSITIQQLDVHYFANYDVAETIASKFLERDNDGEVTCQTLIKYCHQLVSV